MHRDELREGLAWLDEQLPLPAPIWIGQERRDGQRIVSTDPADSRAHRRDRADRAPQRRSRPPFASPSAAIASGRPCRHASAPSSSRAPRPGCASAAPSFAALCVREAGKPWREADGDVAEAIDFCEYYGRPCGSSGRAGFDLPGEDNEFTYVPRGVTPP